MTTEKLDVLAAIAKQVADRCHGSRKHGQAQVRYTIIYQAAFLGAEAALQRNDELEAALERVKAAIDFVEPRDPEAKREAIVRDLEAGMSLRKAAAKHGVGVAVVRGIARIRSQ